MSTVHVRRCRMISRARGILLVGAMVLATACRSDEEPPRDTAPSDQETTASIDAVSDRVLESMDTFVDGGTYPGMLTLVRIGDEMEVMARGLADQGRHEPLTRNHRFRIGSITKPMVAALALQEVERGRLRLSDPVGRWLPELLRDGSRITIKHLLTHSSGLFDAIALPGLGRVVRELPAEPAELVRLADARGPDFAPGHGAEYSNTNFLVLGLILERVSGKPLATSLEARIFRPLRMASTSLEWARADDPPLAHGYVDHQDVTATPELAWAWAAGGVVSTAEDVSRFFRALLRGEIIGRPLLETMTSPLTEGVDRWRSYGLGVAEVDTACGTALGHSGRFPGFMADAWTLDTLDREVVVLVNRYDEQTSDGRPVDQIVREALCE